MEKVGVKVSLRAPHLHPDLVVCVALVCDPVGDGVDHVDLEEVCRRGVGVVQGLLLGGQPLGGVLARHGAHARGRASSGGDGVDAYQGVADGAVVGGVVQHGGGEHPALLAGDTQKNCLENQLLLPVCNCPAPGGMAWEGKRTEEAEKRSHRTSSCRYAKCYNELEDLFAKMPFVFSWFI